MARGWRTIHPGHRPSGPEHATLTLTPGFRVHLGANWYGLGGVELPVTQPQPFDYQVLGGLMKVW